MERSLVAIHGVGSDGSIWYKHLPAIHGLISWNIDSSSDVVTSWSDAGSCRRLQYKSNVELSDSVSY